MTAVAFDTASHVPEMLARIAEQSRYALADATPMPAASYFDPAFYALEQERVFGRDWLAVARVEQVAAPGQSVTHDLLGSALVVHREDGEIVVTRGGQPVRSAVWQGFVFATLAGQDAEPLGMEPIEAAIGNYDLAAYEIVATLNWPAMAAGWKVAVENFLEFYHHVGAHAATLETLMPGLGTRCYDGRDGDQAYYAVCPISAEGATAEVDGHLQIPLLAPAPPELTVAEFSRIIVFVRFPVLMVSLNPDFCFWLQLTPTGPESHDLRIHVLAPRSTRPRITDEQISAAGDFFDAIQAEDAAVNARVQRLMHSARAVGGVLHAQELPLLQFQRYLARMLAASPG